MDAKAAQSTPLNSTPSQDRGTQLESQDPDLGTPAWAKVTSWLGDKKSNFNTN